MRKELSHLTVAVIASFVLAATMTTGCKSSVSSIAWPNLAWWKKEPASDALAANASPTYPTPPSTNFHPKVASTAGTGASPASYSDYASGSRTPTGSYPTTGYGSSTHNGGPSYSTPPANSYGNPAGGASPQKGYYPLSPPSNTNNGYAPGGYPSGGGYGSQSGGYNAPRSADARNAYPGSSTTPAPSYGGAGSHPSYGSASRNTAAAPYGNPGGNSGYGNSGGSTANPWSSNAGQYPQTSTPSWGSGAGQSGRAAPYGQSTASPWNSGASHTPRQDYREPSQSGPSADQPGASYSQLSTTYGQDQSSADNQDRASSDPMDGLVQRRGEYSPGSIAHSYNRVASADTGSSNNTQVQRADYENSRNMPEGGQFSTGGEFQPNSPFDGGSR